MSKPIVLVEKNGITVKALREWLSRLPDDGEVWITADVGVPNACTAAWWAGQGGVVLTDQRTFEVEE